MSGCLEVVKLGDVEINLSVSAVNRRDAVLSFSRLVWICSNDFELENAVDLVKDLRSVSKLTEESRVAVKAPVLMLGKKIDELALTFITPVGNEVARLTHLISNYRACQIKAQKEAQEKAEAAGRALLAAQQQAEAARLEAESVALTPEDEAQAQQELQEAQAEVETALAAVSVPVPVPVALKPQGLVEKTVWKFEIINVWALAAWERSFVRIEPNSNAINEEIRRGTRTIPGLRIWSEIETGVRL